MPTQNDNDERQRKPERAPRDLDVPDSDAVRGGHEDECDATKMTGVVKAPTITLK